MEWIDTGYWGLFLATFLAATILPLSSEALLAAMLLGPFYPVTCLVIATAGNWLGGMSSYGLGWLGDWHHLQRWLRIKETSILRWKRFTDRYGPYTALLCWAPLIGDAIAISLGVFRVNTWSVAWWMLVGKFLRYLVIVHFMTSGLL